jgi:hypothetical protein
MIKLYRRQVTLCSLCLVLGSVLAYSSPVRLYHRPP